MTTGRNTDSRISRIPIAAAVAVVAVAATLNNYS